jgi:hypothetical protein
MTFPDRGRQRGYFKNVAVGIDQSFGTLFGIDADETVSSWCGRNKMGKWQQITIDWIALRFFNEADHCLKSIERGEVK